MSNSSIWPIDRIRPDQNLPRRNGNDRVFRITQSSNITEASPSDCFVSYPGHSLGESYTSAEMQSMYSASPGDRAIVI